MSVTLVQVTAAATRPRSPFLWGDPDLSPIPVSAAIAAGLDWPTDGQLIAWADDTALVVAPTSRVVGDLSDDRHYVVGPLLVQEDTAPPLPIPRPLFDALGWGPGERLSARIEDGRLVVEPLPALVDRLSRRLAAARQPGAVPVSEQLLRDRRGEAAWEVAHESRR